MGSMHHACQWDDDMGLSRPEIQAVLMFRLLHWVWCYVCAGMDLEQDLWSPDILLQLLAQLSLGG